MPSIVCPALSQHDDAIRLVRFDGVDSNGCFNLTLRATTISESSYTALSYVWGSDTPNHMVKLNGTVVWIRQNLWSFLATCWDTLLTRDYWIDALCINQADNEDKNRQIPLMGRIYSTAVFVHAWLYRPSVQGEASKQDINALADGQFCELYNSYFTDTTFNGMSLSKEVLAASTESLSGAVARLLSHEYWSRLWIVQELQLANEIELQYGDARFSYRKLRSLLREMVETLGIYDSLQLHLPDAHRMLQQPFWKHKLPTDNSIEKLCLFELVLIYAGRNCGLIQDRVFALSALASDASSFIFDYSDTPLTLLIQLVRKSAILPSKDQMQALAAVLQIDLSPGAVKFPIQGFCDFRYAALPGSGEKAEDFDTRRRKILPEDIDVPMVKMCSTCFHSRDPTAFVVGMPHTDLLLLVQSFRIRYAQYEMNIGGKKRSLRLHSFVAPDRVQDFFDHPVHHSEAFVAKFDPFGEGENRDDPPNGDSFRLDGKMVQMLADVDYLYDVLAAGLQLGSSIEPSDFLVPMHHWMRTSINKPLCFDGLDETAVEVDLKGTTLNASDALHPVPRVLLVNSNLALKTFWIFIENNKFKVWQDVQNLFSSPAFLTGYDKFGKRLESVLAADDDDDQSGENEEYETNRAERLLRLTGYLHGNQGLY